uniref:RING-type domain-containing protein n=1 Tax=Xenopus tropicalis TaxID=8364 RepID=L7N321_XENTR
MAAFSLRAEVTCSACREIYTDPVTLPCGHNFCLCCIGRHWDWQKGIEEDPSCPECMKTYRRRPELNRNLTLRNIAERFRPTDPEQECSGIFCTYCDSPVPAAKSCLHCEASLCDYHVREHSRAAEHVLTDPTASFGHRKCSEHMELLRYHCTEDGACICATGLQSGEHKEHKVETLSLSRREAEIRAQRLQECSRDVAQKAADETERVTALFRVIGERLEALEKRLLRDISWEQEKVSLQLNDLIQQLEIKKDELSGKIRHIEELYTLLSGLAVIVTGMKEWWLYGQRAMDLVLDTNTAANDVLISPDLKTASFSKAKLYWPKTSARFGKSQALGCRGFSSGRSSWGSRRGAGGSSWGGGGEAAGEPEEVARVEGGKPQRSQRK